METTRAQVHGWGVRMSMGSPFWKDIEYVDVGLEMDGYVYIHACILTCDTASEEGCGIVRAVGAHALCLATEIAHRDAMGYGYLR